MNTRFLFVITLLLFAFSIRTNAQGVVVNEDLDVAKLMQHYTNINQTIKTTDGWRIQLTAVTDRRMLDEMLQNLNTKYPAVPTDWAHIKPYYKIKAGAFMSRVESLKLLSQFKKEFPSAYPALDSGIKPREFIATK